MKKSLLALAVLGAFAGAASAQTNVTVYGLIDTAIQYTDNGAATNSKTWSLDSGTAANQYGSRLGFKGTEDLGGGLSAIFTLENGFLADTGRIDQQGQLFGRQAFVGLQGSFGAVKFGRQYTPMHIAVDSIDPFSTGMAGNIEGVGTALFNPYGIRMDNTVNYSITSGAFSGQAAYGFGETAGSTSANRQFGLSAGYANGPINAVFAYHNAKPGTVAATGDVKGTFVGGTYDFGVAKAHLAYQQDKASDTTGVDTTDNRDWMIGVSAPIGAGTVLASYVRKDDRLVANNDAKQWALGYTYNLSKRTNLYTSYGRVDNQNTADTSVFNVGVAHKF